MRSILMPMNTRPLLVLATLAAATAPDMGKGALAALNGGVREKFTEDPMGSVLGTVLGGAWLFYHAEVGHNPKVESYYDALVYVSTCLSVGYSDIFAKTPLGKAIGSALMTYGPAMATRMFDPPAKGGAPEAHTDDVVHRLDRIIEALEGLRRERGRELAPAEG